MLTVENSRDFEFIQGLTAELSSKELIFPTSLNATMKIRHALNDPHISNDNVARIVGAEPVLSAQVLRLSNTVVNNPTGTRISELRNATRLLGFSAVRNVAISVGMKQLMEHKANGQPSKLVEGLWNRSLRVAVLSYMIAKKLSRISPDKAMMAGLLHDVGKFYILNRARHYQELFVTQTALWDLVDQWHASIGAAILENWEVDDDIRVAVMDHRSSDMSLSSRPSLTDVVATADFLDAHFVDDTLIDLNWDTVPVSLRNLQLDLDKSGELLRETKQELDLILQAIS